MEFHSNIDFQQCTDCPTSTKLEGVQSLDALIRPKTTLLDHIFLILFSIWLVRILYFCLGCIGGGYCKGVIVREEERSLTGFHTIYTY